MIVKEKEHTNALLRQPYDNYKIFHPDGTLMCFCSSKKANWYLKRDLATKIGTDEIHLTFTPRGYGDPQEILIGRSNSCVVSGLNILLTKHHVIPTQYRQCFEKVYKDKNSSDLVVLNREIHDAYEVHATIFKEKLFEDFVDDSFKNIEYAWIEAKSMYNCLTKHYDDLPITKQVYMIGKLDAMKKQYGFTEKQLKSKFLRDVYDYNQIIVSKIGTENLIVMWKYHFIKYGKPKYLPVWWKPNMIKTIQKLDSTQRNKTELVEIDITEPYLQSLLIKYDLL